MSTTPSTRPVMIAPSLLASDFSRLGEEVRGVEQAGADWLHLDVMDGHFVPNISFGPLVVKALRKHCALPFDVHLMISPVDAYLEAFAAAGADHITIHVEAGPNTHRSLQYIASLGKIAGVAINPATPLDQVATVLDMIGLVNVMTVNPGFGGQSFLASQLPRIAALRRMIDASGRNIRLQIDGGVDKVTSLQAIEAGADVLVAGTSVYGSTDYAAAIAGLRPIGRSPPA